MSRVLVEVELLGKKLNAILDIGARGSYIRKDLAKNLLSYTTEPLRVGLGGKEFTISEQVVVSGKIKDTEGNSYKFVKLFSPVDDLGEEDGKRIDILIGAIILEEWGTVIDESVHPPKVDFTILRRGELTEL